MNNTDSRRKHLGALASAAVILIAIIILGGWLTDHARLMAVLPSIHRMTFNTGLCFLLTGAACLLSFINWRFGHRIQMVLGALVAVFAGVVLLQDLVAIELGVDELFLDQTRVYSDSLHPGRMSPFTAFSFLLLGGAMVISTATSRRSMLPNIARLLVLSIALLNLVVQILFPLTPGPLIHLLSMSPFTILAFLLLVSALWLRCPTDMKHGILAPGVALMLRLKVSWKFRLLLFIVLLPFAYSLSFMSTEIGNNVVQVRKQQLALGYVQAISSVLELVPQHRGLMNSYLYGDLALHPQIERLRGGIEGEIVALDEYQSRGNIPVEFKEKWSLLWARWRDLESMTLGPSVETSWVQHTELIAEILDLNEEIYLRFDLVLEEDSGVRSLGSVLFEYLPVLIEGLGQLRGQGAAFLVDGEFSPAEKTKLIELGERVRVQIKKARWHFAMAYGAEPQLQERFKHLVTGAFSSASAYGSLLARQASANRAPEIRSSEFFEQGTNIISENYRLLRALTDFMLVHEENDLTAQYLVAYRVTALVLVAMMLILYLWFAFSRTLHRSVSDMALVAERLLHDESTRGIQVSGHDELAQITHSFNEVAARLRNRNKRLHTVMDHVHDGIVTIDSEGCIDSVNTAMGKMFGYEPEALVGKNITMLIPESLRAAHEEGLRGYVAHSAASSAVVGKEAALEGRRRDGSHFPLELRVDKLRLGGKRYFLGALRDITRRTQAEAALMAMATTDSLTGVRNRRDFFLHGERAVSQACRYLQPLAIIMIDIDHFKRVNDSHGHPVGDQVLKAVSACCTEALRENDIFARIGGEEFAVVMPQTTIAAAEISAERLRAAVEALSVPIEDGQLQVTISLGLATLESDDIDLDELLKRADNALYRAKENGRNRFELWSA